VVKIVLTGLNGYGGHFIEPLLEGNGSHKLMAVVSRDPKKSPYYECLQKNQVHFYDSLENCLEAENMDMAIITTPMHVHFREVMCALKKGLSVYCEKPLAVDAEQCRRIAEAAKERGAQVAVGYQWSHSKAVTDLKKDLLAGKYGKLQKIKSLAVWSRTKSYYGESDWKGRYYGKNGESIQESVISNGTSHFLHNLLFLSGEVLDQAAVPVHIYGEAYRAHAIETFDTACIKMKTENGCELFYMATLSAKENHAPEFMIECEKASISYPAGTGKEIVAKRKDTGEVVCYGSPDEERFEHFKKVVNAIRGQGEINCDAETVLPVTRVCDWMIKNVKIIDFPKEKVVENGDMLYVEGLDAFMRNCYTQEKMFAESGQMGGYFGADGSH